MPELDQDSRRALKEIGRGVAGGLLFSLPLLYTMEIWWTGFVALPIRLLIYMLGTFGLLLAFNYYVGIRRRFSWAEEIMDAVEEMGLGLLLATVVLVLLGRITSMTDWQVSLGMVVAEAMPVAIGVSVGKTQLGGGGGEEKGNAGSEGEEKGKAPRDEDGEEASSSEEGQGHNAQDKAMGSSLVMAALGAIVVAANVAPTEEILLIGIDAQPWKLVGLAAFSLAVGGLVLYYSDFQGAQAIGPESALDVIAGLSVMYATALVVSAFLCWFFGHFDGTTLPVAVSVTVVLALPATLGASAGRLLLQG